MDIQYYIRIPKKYFQQLVINISKNFLIYTYIHIYDIKQYFKL